MNEKLIKEIEAAGVTLVAVSKTKPVEIIKSLYHSGQRDFGENRVQEMIEKESSLPEDIRWHMIGHLQKNKVKYIAPFVHLIHSVDSLNLAKVIGKEARKNNRIIDVLVQIRIAREDSKTGLEWQQLFEDLDAFKNIDSIRYCGVMGIGTLTDDENITRSEFRFLKQCFGKLQSDEFSEEPAFKEISMGMSSDYPLAIEEGATMVRIGSLIFGARH